MFQKFFGDTIQTKFIKNLVCNTPLPIYNTISDGDYLIKDALYVYQNNIIRCTRSGYLKTERQQGLCCSPEVICGVGLICGADGAYLNPAKYEYVQSYTFGERLDKVTVEHTCRYNYYDGETHRYLGNYLRCYRDVTGVDLMPFYNCYNYTTTRDFFFKDNGEITTDNSEFYTIHLIPIRFNRRYTIAIDCDAPVRYKSVFWGNVGLLPMHGNTHEKYLTSILGEGLRTAINPNFDHPFIYYIGTSDLNTYRYEKYLYLALQVPISNQSTITVLEGDYSSDAYKQINAEELNMIPTIRKNKVMLSKLGLLRINDGNIYAFSDRLIEYLLKNVITGEDEFWKNIYKVQDLIGYSNRGDFTNGVWDDRIRYKLYTRYMQDRLKDPVDINGYVDRDIEAFIAGGLE